MDKNFWKTKKLSDFTEEEWEAVCMRCGKCCLIKRAEGSKIYFTNIICSSYDLKNGCCSCYATRLGAFCAKVDMDLLTKEPELLPETCAYRLLLAGKDLPEYHPLICGNFASIHKAGKTVLELPDIFLLKEKLDFIKEMYETTKGKTFSTQKLQEFLARTEKYKEINIETYDIPAKH